MGEHPELYSEPPADDGGDPPDSFYLVIGNSSIALQPVWQYQVLLHPINVTRWSDCTESEYLRLLKEGAVVRILYARSSVEPEVMKDELEKALEHQCLYKEKLSFQCAFQALKGTNFCYTHTDREVDDDDGDIG